MIEAILSLIRLRGGKSRLQRNNGKGVVCDRKGEEVNTKDKTFRQRVMGASPWWELGLLGLTGKEGECGWQRRKWILSAAKWDRRREGRGVEEPENRPQRRSRLIQTSHEGLVVDLYVSGLSLSIKWECSDYLNNFVGQLRVVYVRCLTEGPEQMFLLNNSNHESTGWRLSSKNMLDLRGSGT